MIGTIANCATILLGTAIGSTLKKGIGERYKTILLQAMGLSATALGIHSIAGALPDSRFPVLFIISLALGGLAGEKLDLENGFSRAVGRFSNGNLAQGLSTAILLFCAGTLSILGPMESALHNNNTFLFTNAILDGVTSIVLASSFGWGIGLAAVVLFLWQGTIYLFATLIAPFVTPALLTEISVIGGVLILSSGLGILEIKKIKTLNLLPALAVPALFFGIRALFGL